MLLAYVIARLISIWSTRLLFLIVLIWFLGEIVLGLTQLFGFSISNSDLYEMTGSFKNPGPYGGFLSVCLSVSIASLIQLNDKRNRNDNHVLIYYIISAIILLGLFVLICSQSRAAILGLACSFYFLIKKTNQKTKRLNIFLKKHGALVLLCSLILGIGAYLYKKPSADSRLFINKMCIITMRENGWKGVGWGNFGKAYSEAQANYFNMFIKTPDGDKTCCNKFIETERLISDCPINAFNEYLFIGIEAGLIPMLLFIVMLIYLLVVSYRANMIWFYGLMTFSVFAFFSYPLHTKEFQLLFPILIASCMPFTKKENYENPRLFFSINVLLMVSFTTFLVALLFLKPQIQMRNRAEIKWKSSEQWFYLKRYDYVVEDYDTLFPFLKNNQKYIFEYGQSLSKLGDYKKSDYVLRLGTEISSDPMFWNVMGNNSVEQGNYQEAEERYRHAFYMVPNRLYPLYLLAKLYHTECDTTRFLKMADIVETFVPKVESENTERLRLEIRELKKDYVTNYLKNE